MTRQQRLDRRWWRRRGRRYAIEVYGARITRLRDAALPDSCYYLVLPCAG